MTTPAHSLTRPTTDRVREAVFSIIADFFERGGSPADEALQGVSFCDLYAGSGAVGLEAASRGSSPVLLVEKDRSTAALIGSNAKELSLNVDVRVGAVEKIVAGMPPTPFRIVWLDPPYDTPASTVGLVLSRLCDNGWLAADPLVIVERSSRAEPIIWPDRLPDRWARRYGETMLHFGAEEA